VPQHAKVECPRINGLWLTCFWLVVSTSMFWFTPRVSQWNPSACSISLSTQTDVPKSCSLSNPRVFLSEIPTSSCWIFLLLQLVPHFPWWNANCPLPNAQCLLLESQPP
jgi:hypothetical protein